MNRRIRRVLKRKIRQGALFGRDPHTGRFGNLGKAILWATVGRAGALTLIERKNGKMEWIPERDVWNVESLSGEV